MKDARIPLGYIINVVKVICNCFTDLIIIKEWGCFARQKAFHRKDVKSAKEKESILATSTKQHVGQVIQVESRSVTNIDIK